MHSRVAVHLLGPEIGSEEAGDDANGDDLSTLDESNDGTDTDSTIGAAGDDSEERDGDATLGRTPPGRRLRRTVLLGSGLPTAGSLLARLGRDGGAETQEIPPGAGYAIEASILFSVWFAPFCRV